MINIIKSLKSNDFAKDVSFGSPEAHWQWGIDKDGVLYGKGAITGHHYSNWFPYQSMEFGISLKEMIKIAKAFGQLLTII